MKVLTAIWNDNIGEASVKFSKEFDESHRVVKLDALIDILHEVRNEYERLIAEEKTK